MNFVIPWVLLKPEIKSVAMDSDGRWVGYEDKPELGGSFWHSFTTNHSLDCLNLPTAENWRESLQERPEVEPAVTEVYKVDNGVAFRWGLLVDDEALTDEMAHLLEGGNA